MNTDIVDFEDDLDLNDEGVTSNEAAALISNKPMAEKNRQFLGMFSQSPIIRTVSGFWLPLVVAAAITALLLIPDMKKIPIIGYFRKTFGFVAIALWLVCIIFTIIAMTMDGQYFVLTKNQQILTLILIAAGGLVYNLLFNMDKTPASANQMLLQAQSAYSNAWSSYLSAGNTSLEKEKEVFNNLSGRIASIVQSTDQISIADQQAIVTPLELETVDETAKTGTPIIRIEKCMSVIYDKQNTYQVGGMPIKPNQGISLPAGSTRKADASSVQTSLASMEAVVAADPQIVAVTATPTKTAALADLTAYNANITLLIAEAATLEAAGDFARAEKLYTEAFNKGAFIICGPTHAWAGVEFTADPASAGFWLASDLATYKASAQCGVQSFTQPGDNLWKEDRESIQDLIDSGTIG